MTGPFAGDELAFADHLTALGAPIFTAQAGGAEFVGRPDGWVLLDPARNADRIASWRPGSAICGVLGGRVAVVDVDTKNGADVVAVRRLLVELAVTVFAEVESPGGPGYHFYVAGHPALPSVAARKGRDGLTGYPGVEILAHGRNAFLPGTLRPKYDRRGYRIVFDNLDALADGGDPDGAEALADWVAHHRSVPATEPVAPAPPWDGKPLDERQRKYVDAALSGEVQVVAETRTGSRNIALFTAAMKLGGYVVGSGLDEQRVITALTAAAVTNGLVADKGAASVAASIRSGLRNGKVKPKAVPPASSEAKNDVDDDGTGKEEKKSAATIIFEIALQDHRLGVSLDGDAFAVPLEGPRLVRPLRGGKIGLRAELARAYRARTGKVAGQQALADALLALEGEAAESEPEAVALRVADHEGARWLDLGTVDGSAVRIDATGWTVETVVPVLFKRTALTAALPVPEAGGSLQQLWELLNVEPDDRPLLAAWLVSLFWPEIAHPIPALFGEQGTGKTTAARMLTTLVDPSPVPVRKAPRDADSWITAATGSWIVALDNLSDVNPWLSDTLCRAVTGDGDVRRQLYTDGGLIVFAFRRCVLLTGIDIGAVRGDLADRLLIIDLHRIGDRARREDSELWAHWADLHPRLLGAVLDLVASVGRVAPSVELETKPRMADFARIVAAVDMVLGTEGLKRYANRAETLAVDSLTADPFVTAMAEQLTKEFTGTAAQLLMMVVTTEKRPPKGWPETARAATTLLRRQAAVMRLAGWTVDEQPAGHDNAIRWIVASPEIIRIEGSQGSQGSQQGTDASDASDGNGQSQGRDQFKAVS